jgi:cytochrome c oxidase assembly protein subunit 15
MNINSADINRRIARWLLACCALVFVMVVLGGVTRLTGSGLSMVDWRPVTGMLPPLSDEAWQRTFEMYQQTPEFEKKNAHMDVNDFKGIFWLEYLHRLLGRIIGIAFLLPFVYFMAKGWIRRDEWLKYGAMFVLGGFQGLLGWYMVKSGLVDNPNVSQYRLTAHLISAFLIYAYMLWVALSLLYPADGAQRHSWYGKSLALTALITVTVISGGFVAGLKAGKIYNTFPMMGSYWVPPDFMALDPWWRNLFDNMATVQFDHRVLAITTFLLIVAFWWRIGIATLLLVVPIPLAAAHQAVAMLLFTAALLLTHSLRHA